MISPAPITLEGHGVRLEPLSADHADELAAAAADGRLWELWYTAEALGAKKDGVIRHHQARRDGTVRDSVMYSILAAEWPDVNRHLATRLARGGRQTGSRAGSTA